MTMKATEPVPTGNVVDAGDIDIAGGLKWQCALLIQFATEEDCRRAIQARRCEFTVFETPKEKVR